jgi:hypothetical protein
MPRLLHWLELLSPKVALVRHCVDTALVGPTLCWHRSHCEGVRRPAANAQVQSPSPGLSDQSPDISDQKLDAVPGLSDQSPNISDQKLDAVATAIERVASLKQDYRQRIAAAAPSDKERIAIEAINALAKAVTDQGLSLKEYDSILEVAQNDREVRGKIRQRIRPSAKPLE